VPTLETYGFFARWEGTVFERFVLSDSEKFVLDAISYRGCRSGALSVYEKWQMCEG